jgi:predicted unusual protein kinase regulating ubiquinone biosynthesis (AarF/ABC1/UbiB family)
MVVVEGVARSLDPRCNIWQAAAPVVEVYIRERLGPRQALRDAAETLQVLSRLGPRLPGIADELVLLAEEARLKRLRIPLGVRVREFPTPNLSRPVLAGFVLGLGVAGGLVALFG